MSAVNWAGVILLVLGFGSGIGVGYRFGREAERQDEHVRRFLHSRKEEEK